MIKTYERNLPLDAVCGEIDIKIDSRGQWYHEGSPIGRIELVKLFSKVLKKDSNGEYWLETPIEKGRIQVEDVPFMAVTVSSEGKGDSQVLTFKTNVGESIKAGIDNPIRIDVKKKTLEPIPYISVRDNLEAKITRAVFYEIVDLGTVHNGKFGIWSDEVFFPLVDAKDIN